MIVPILYHPICGVGRLFRFHCFGRLNLVVLYIHHPSHLHQMVEVSSLNQQTKFVIVFNLFVSISSRWNSLKVADLLDSY